MKKKIIIVITIVLNCIFSIAFPQKDTTTKVLISIKKIDWCMEQYYENKTCDTLLKLKQQQLKLKEREISKLNDNIMLFEQKDTIQKNVIKELRSYSLELDKKNVEQSIEIERKDYKIKTNKRIALITGIIAVIEALIITLIIK